MKINHQTLLTTRPAPYLQGPSPDRGAVEHDRNQQSPNAETRPVRVIAADNLERINSFRHKMQASDYSELSKRGREAISAYQSQQHNIDRDYLTQVLGVDEYV